MRIETIQYLACPVCQNTTIAIDDKILPIVGTDAEIFEGSLSCSSCKYRTVILAGLGILTPNPFDYLVAQKSVLCRSELSSNRSKACEALLADLPEHPYGMGRQETWETPHGIAVYASMQYLEREESAFYDYIAEITDSGVDGANTQGSLAVDVGSNVGGVTRRLAARFSYAIGVDLSLLALAEARRLNFHASGKPVEIREPVSATRCEPRSQCLTAQENMDFIIGDATALPIRRSAATVLAAINLIDITPNPTKTLRALFEFSQSSHSVLTVATPYYFRVDRNPPSTWGELEEFGVAEILQKWGAKIFSSEKKMWRLRFYPRYVQEWECDVVVAGT